MQDNEKLAYKVNAAAAALDISRSKLYDLMKQGEVGYVCIGAARRIPYSEMVRISSNGMAGTNANLNLQNANYATKRRRK